ncbi:17397_t:CDS:2, partial [Funneliformis caledonium]
TSHDNVIRESSDKDKEDINVGPTYNGASQSTYDEVSQSLQKNVSLSKSRKNSRKRSLNNGDDDKLF